MPEMYLYGWSVKRKKGKTWRILSFFQVSKHYFILYQVSSFHILTPLNTSLVYNKCHKAWPVKKCRSHSSHSELRPSTTSDTGGGKWEKRIQSVKNTLKNSSHTPFHLGERERDRNMEVKQMRRKSSVCVFFFFRDQLSPKYNDGWLVSSRSRWSSMALGVNGAFLHLFHSQGFRLETQA